MILVCSCSTAVGVQLLIGFDRLDVDVDAVAERKCRKFFGL